MKEDAERVSDEGRDSTVSGSEPEGWAEAIANLLREKQAQREAAKVNQEHQTEKPQNYTPVVSRPGAKRRGDPHWGNPPANTETNPPERSKTTTIEEALGFEDREEKP